VTRIAYGLLLTAAFAFAWVFGGFTLYFTLYALLLLPALSGVYALVLLLGLRVTQKCASTTVIKGEPAYYEIHIRNFTPFMHPLVQCKLLDDPFAIRHENIFSAFPVTPFSKNVHTLHFRARCRGDYPLGLCRVEVSGFLGMFAFKRKIKSAFALTVLPRVPELENFPLAALLSQAASAFEAKEEDYASVSDIRAYRPEDSLKRIHWKLTAKRGEWLVKNYQSNARGSVQVAINTGRGALAREEALLLEDLVLEHALSVIKFCLGKRIPAVLTLPEGVAAAGGVPGDFDRFLFTSSGIRFSESGDHALSLLECCLSGSDGYRNAVVATALLDAAFCERVISENRAGNTVAVLYFVPKQPDKASEEMYRRLRESGADVYRTGVGDGAETAENDSKQY
jgi:uncharacterized protein (DUF58 family)